MADWFYAQQGKQLGPVAADVIRSMLASGTLAAHELVWRDGMPAWQPANSVAELAPGAPPPLPAPMASQLAYASPMPRTSDDIGQNAGIRMLIPVGRSGWAIAAGYLGLLSVLVLPAPFALICGIFAILDIKRNPHRHGMGRAIFGIVMGLLGTIAAIFVLIAFVFAP